jgi:hypothetical protein
MGYDLALSYDHLPRGGHLPEGVSETVLPPVECLAKIRNEIFSRSPSFGGNAPIEVDADTWHAARSELEGILRARGWALVEAVNAQRPNFLLAGVPVICRG